jgi:hypothetical protein
MSSGHQRAMLLRHSWVTQVLGMGPNALRAAEWTLRVLTEARFTLALGCLLDGLLAHRSTPPYRAGLRAGSPTPSTVSGTGQVLSR